MFLRGGSSYQGNEQVARGPFLMIFQDPSDTAMRPQLRAAVRRVKLEQLGHWMMGRTHVGGHFFGVSGAYGADGLPIHLPHRDFDGHVHKIGEPYDNSKEVADVWAACHPVPQELQDAFWAGGGHNTCGSEGPLFRAWAAEHEAILIKDAKDGSYSRDEKRDGAAGL